MKKKKKQEEPQTILDAVNDTQHKLDPYVIAAMICASIGFSLDRLSQIPAIEKYAQGYLHLAAVTHDFLIDSFNVSEEDYQLLRQKMYLESPECVAYDVMDDNCKFTFV